MEKKIHHIVLTGGPCAGKTSAIAVMEQELTQKGYVVFIVPETATEIIKSGYAPWLKCTTNLDFQRFIMKKQLHKEKLYLQIAESVSAPKIVIIYDRGIVDGKSYMSNSEYVGLLHELGLNEVSAKDRYDAVIHLVTAADGAEEFYTLGNNEARTETPEQARVLDRKCIENWTGHSHLRVIDNSTDFEGKISRVLKETYAILGDPVPIEIERKYLVQMPDLSKMPNFEVVNILQTYLTTNDNTVERRIRQRGIQGSYSYYFTEKQEISAMKRVERERRISQNEYLNLLTEADTTLRQIAKKRICFIYKNQYFELDMYEFLKDKAILEIELTTECTSVDIPDFIKVIKEVTDDEAYRNYSIAHGDVEHWGRCTLGMLKMCK